jgi:GNAT superfamily N-acetyltransferase
VADLLSAIAANHRAWFRRCAAVTGGGVRGEVIVDGGHGTLAFPRSRSAAALDDAMRLGLRSMSCWSLDVDRTLGARLQERGFEWGWQPHWMGLDLARPLAAEPRHAVVEQRGADPAGLPYGNPHPVPRAAHRLVVLEDGRTVGRVVVNPWQGTAGVYDMGAVPDRRRRGIGLALTLAACRLARELGCTHAVLNATDDGEPVYRAAGFESLGWGQTWWLHPR